MKSFCLQFDLLKLWFFEGKKKNWYFHTYTWGFWRFFAASSRIFLFSSWVVISWLVVVVEVEVCWGLLDGVGAELGFGEVVFEGADPRPIDQKKLWINIQINEKNDWFWFWFSWFLETVCWEAPLILMLRLKRKIKKTMENRNKIQERN